MSHQNRRTFLASAAAVAAGSALPFGRLFRGLGGMAFGQAAAGAGPTLVQFVLIDKVQACLFQKIDGTPPTGADSQGGIAQKESTFRSMGLTSLFGDGLAELPATVNLALNNTWESGTTGHSLASARLSGSFGSVNYAFEKISGGSGILGPVGFNIRSDVNASGDAFRDGNDAPLQSYTGVDKLLETVQGSIASLSALKSNAALIQKMDGLVTNDQAIRKALAPLIDKVDQVVPRLTDAAGTTDQLDAQVKAVIALSQAGLARNFMIAIPWDDTNNGGDLAKADGPFTSIPKIAKALVDLHKAIPELFCVSTSDGGRAADNGDASSGFAFMTGPAKTVKNVVVGGRFTSVDQLGRTFGDAALSNGSKAPSTPANWYATVLKAMGLGDTDPFVSETLV